MRMYRHTYTRTAARSEPPEPSILPEQSPSALRPQPYNPTPHTAKIEALNPKPLGIQSRVKSLRSSATDTSPGRMT